MEVMKSQADHRSVSTPEVTFTLPFDLSFSDLRLRWLTGGMVGFEWEAIERLCEASSIDPNLIRNSGPGNVGKLISYWYILHRLNGGEPDLVKEEAMSIAATEAWGDIQYVHAPGHA